MARIPSYAKVHQYPYSIDRMPTHPDLVALAMMTIAGWSSAQVVLGYAFGSLIGVRSPVAMSMYAAFDTFAPQKRLLETAARETLPARYARIFQATLTVVDRAALDRHRFAHWIWSADRDARGLRLVEPRHLWKVRVQQVRHWRRTREYDIDALLKKPDLDPTLVISYSEKALQLACAKMERAWTYARRLLELADARPAERRGIYRQLASQPEIQSALDKLRPPTAKRRKAPPAPPRVSRAARRKAALARRAEQGGS